ncbi:hypothetical protein BCR33DRAFT_717465 [Rhizoclosmatium globosum]|uniref:Uncharacterized protein n=1 Tax=Rhizoclosmatium globosum TaxID=329046 RepID=A0A1Y2C9X1_9FUNG|nr:hypothetical protein BCR33DRAFT_717465 [Rhizoclosmatium globosum]|eukprot:ORY43831.1 hypothetical protein BCR33DRAFT_717465 [Rhizoclosmatium globosum]
MRSLYHRKEEETTLLFHLSSPSLQPFPLPVLFFTVFLYVIFCYNQNLVCQQVCLLEVLS